jgi:hypothetical protein
VRHSVRNSDKTEGVVAQGRVFEQEQIARAVELGIGVDRPEGIDIVTANA